MKQPGKPLIIAALAVLCLIWGTTWAAIQIGLEGIPPMTGVALRFAIAASVIFLLAHFLKVRIGTSSRERVLWLVNAVFTFCVTYGVIYWAEQWVPSGLAAVLAATYTLFVALLAHFILPDESLRRAEVIGILVGFAGVGVIFSADFSALGGDQVAVASAVILLAPLATAVASVTIKRWGAGIHPFSLTAVPMAMTAGVMGAVALAFERQAGIIWSPSSIGALLYLAIFGSVVTFTLYFWLLSHMPAKRLALIAYVIPVVAVAIGALRGEPLTLHTLVGAALVVAGTALSVHHFSSNRQVR